MIAQRLLLLGPLVVGLVSVPASAQTDAQGPQPLEWYLPAGIAYDADFPRPESVLGWGVGDWHVRHDQLVGWFRAVAEASPRFSLETYGYTHEQRPLLLATVTSPANLARIDEIREAHVNAVLSGDEAYEGPEVVWMGYSVHGNESSGSSAAMLFAYHLAAATGPEIERFLEDTIVLIDPCLNPDGLSRHAQWANSHKGRNLVGDPDHREHREVWPGGRTNHYWFDLNRDWLLLTHPESRGRLAKFHAWMPQVLTDYHEMGTNSTYFFQPGIPSRQNPLTPERNLELTREIATYHADALDELGSLYYTEESFDDFYYGKGSTYPDLHGAIGILFEQASSRGHFQENDFGGISFPFTIRNQFVTSLSTLAAVDGMHDSLSGYQREFYRTALEEAAAHDVRAYVFGAAEDPERTFRMVDILRRHGIEVRHLGRDLDADDDDGTAFSADGSYVVDLQQPQFRLIRALFETRTSWPDNTFYDVSSWNLPLSFNVPYRALDADAAIGELIGAPAEEDFAPGGSVIGAERVVAWLFEWHHYNAPRALNRMLEAGVRAQVATRPFSVETGAGPRDFDYGTIVVPVGVQRLSRDELRALADAAAADGLEVHAATTGLTFDGVDLGSGSLSSLEAPQALMLVGSGVSSYEAGEVWHYLDTRVDMGVSMVEKEAFGGLDLERYTHLLLVAGATGGWGEREESRVRDWVRGGGVLVATKSSGEWAAEHLMGNREDEPDDAPKAKSDEIAEGDEPGDDATEDEDGEPEPSPPIYADYEDQAAVSRVAGTIFRAQLDTTHPLCFGFVRDELPVFKNSTAVLPESEDPFAVPVRYTDAPLVSGYASDENAEKIAGTPAVRAARLGAGTVVAMIDDPNFRGVWYGTNKLYANAIFFGGAIKRTGPLDDAADDGVDSHGHGH
ncbi:M14 metallopeptidase family protein [Engelhardtia mirabilis]|uniref:Zinc carboxypeptidase n=1 Tax=Engelhardtia mirabilis TaxID=2528011 RepID=A0A518BEJ8_9BACT|nr:Zinc carboxypeptidase [Planctomycetes bacterium Pla133]QDU99698.1 Zinc carboxypeptidase [Planctomycetes bacterium Pla86]